MRPQQQSLRNYFGGNSSGGPPRPSTSGFSYPPPATASSLSSSVSDWGSRERGFSFSPSPPTKPFIPPSASPPPVTTTSSPPPTSSFSSSPPDSSNPPLCSGHNLPCALRTVQKNNANKGRRFWTCPMPQDEQCRSFRWAEEGQVSSPPLSPPRSPQPPSSSASQTASTAPITSYFQPRGKVEGGSVKATSSPFFGNSNTSSASQPEPSTHSAASRRLFSSSSSSFSSSSSAASSFASPSSSDSASTSTWSGFSMTQPQQQPFKERSNQELLAMLSQQQQPNSYQYQHHQESIINSAPSSFHVDSSGPSSLPSASAFAFRPSSSISSSKATQPTTNNVNDSFNNKRARSPEPQPAFYQSVSQTQPQRQELQRQSTTSQTNIVSPRKPSASSSMMRVGVSSDDTDAFPSKRKRPNQMEMEDGDNDVSDALLDLDREEWYWIKHPKDAKGNEPGSPDYDPSTLYVPVNALLNMTETERQYWEIKSKHWDKLVFFKVGKFYELYNKDADVGHQVLDLKLTTKKSRKGAWNMRQAGVPQQKFDPWCAKLVGLGYKLVIVDETETRIGANVRMRENAKKGVRQSRAITREVSRILTRGTLVDESLLNDPRANYLMVIKESLDAPEEENRVYDNLEAPSLPRHREPPHPRFGICLVDASTGDFNIYEFVDDAARNHLETLLLREKPQEVLYERGKCSRQTMSAIKRNLTCPTLNARSTDDEFWTAAKTVDHFRETNYFHKSDPDHPSPMNIEDSWPNELQMLAAEKKDLALSALGACVQYLQELHLDQELISLRKFHIYQDVGDGRVTTDYLILDGKTLVNLEIFENTVDGGPEGTLSKLMDHCVSPFGKRLFRRWLTKPLHNVADINDRLDAVEDFNNMDDTQMMGFRSRLEECLKNLPDLERLISRIHAGSANIKQFLRVLIGFEQIWNLITEEFQRIAVKSKLLQALLTVNSRTTPSGRQGLFPSTLGEPLGNFRTAFDWDTAIERDKIIPNEGTDEGYDQARARVADVENALEMHLQEQRDLLGTEELYYSTCGSDKWLITVSNTVLQRIRVPSSWTERSNTKTVKRFWNPTITNLLGELEEANDYLETYLSSVLNQHMSQFDAHFYEWAEAVSCVAQLDALLSLAKASTSYGPEPMTRPEFIEPTRTSNGSYRNNVYLELRDMRHPCITPKIGDTFTPNDVILADAPQQGHPPVVLLTGPNMGGKSTLLRQVCIAVIMAQMGCFVAASRCKLSPADRIFTRIGANDNIMAGQSTFMVELQETANILSYATPHSLVILDELGRGTSTFDGYSIAYAVLRDLAERIGCRTLFSTHYHLLTDEFQGHPGVALYYMSCHVDEENQEIIFLYKFTRGVCPKSYGMNVARAAGVLDSVVRRAERIATSFEEDPAALDMDRILREEEPEKEKEKEKETEETNDDSSFQLGQLELQAFQGIATAPKTMANYASLFQAWASLNQH